MAHVLLARTGRGMRLTPDLFRLAESLGFPAETFRYVRTVAEMMRYSDSKHEKPQLILASGVLTGHNRDGTAIEVEATDMLRYLADKWDAKLEFVEHA